MMSIDQINRTMIINAETEENVIYVPRPILDNMCRLSSVQHLSKNKVNEFITHNNITYVTTGYGASGHEGNLWCWAKKVVPLALYTGHLKPLSYNECLHEIETGKRERGYNGQLITHEGKSFVILDGDSIVFKPTEEGVQLNLL